MLRITPPWGKKAESRDAELLLDDLRVPIDSKGFSDTHLGSIKASARRTKYLSGWRLSVIGCICLGLSIMLANFGITIWVLTNFATIKGVATVYEGSCEKSKSYTTWIHLGINILGTGLLGASNYCMQVLCAPTREEIDVAHARHRWLRIGIPSIKNLMYVDRRKCLLWVSLGLSSIPLHLLWNSAVVDTLSSNAYIYGGATENFLNGIPLHPNISADPLYGFDGASIMRDKYTSNSLSSLSVADCIKAYSGTYVSEYGNVLLIYDNATGNTSLLHQDTQSATEVDSAAGGWMCGYSHDCDLNGLSRQNTTTWDPWKGYDIKNTIWALRSFPNDIEDDAIFFEGSVRYCVAEKLNHPCRLGMSPPILITVLVCNAIKTVCFILTLWVVGSGYPLVSNGDAVESFLLRPDTSLQHCCLVSKTIVRRKKDIWLEHALPLQWLSKRRLWAAGASKGFWLSTFIPALMLIIAIISICVQGEVWASGTATIVAGGFGKPSTNYLIGEGIYGPQQSPTTASLLANIPQLVVSYIYLAYNGLFTSMLATAEWVGYSLRPQGLRVAWPKGFQKSRAFLQLPYIYAIPIMTASTLLHWLISQSLFLVRIDVYGYGGVEDPGAAVSTVGFSPYAIIWAIVMGGVMLVAVLLLGTLRRYPTTMPLAACCSASIAAACQPREGTTTETLPYKKLQWGVINQGMADGHETFEHACFSAEEVTPLVAGETYA